MGGFTQLTSPLLRVLKQRGAMLEKHASAYCPRSSRLHLLSFLHLPSTGPQLHRRLRSCETEGASCKELSRIFSNLEMT